MMHQAIEYLEKIDFSSADFKVRGSGPEPKNNDGLSRCYWCGAPTRKWEGIRHWHNVCTSVVCGK